MADEEEQITLLTGAEENGKMWHKVRVYRADHKPRALYDSFAYIFAADAVEVLDIYRAIPGIKHSPSKGARFPDILHLSSKEVQKLEREIIKEGISLSKAKKTWYYPITI
jgi:hypothetical protein